MKLEQSFDVAAPMERVWQALIDVERVAPCLPGATITGRNDDGSYNGSFTVKIGPTTASYTGKLDMESVDEGARTATMSAQGSDKRGQGGATATIESRLETAEDGRTRVLVATDYHITGRLARFGRGGMIEDISERLLKEFGGRLAELLEGSGDGGADAGAPAGDTASGDAGEAPTSEQETAEAPVVAPESAEAAEAPAAEPEEPPATDAEEPPATEAEEAPPTEAEEAPPTEAEEAPPTEPPPTEAEEPPPTDVPEPPPIEAAPPSPPPPNEPLDAGSLVGSVMADRVKRNPWPLVAGVLLLLVVLRRRRR